MAVKATATCMGKKSAKTGIKRVPSPKPEKRVNPEAMSAEIEIIKYSMFNPISYHIFIKSLLPSLFPARRVAEETKVGFMPLFGPSQAEEAWGDFIQFNYPPFTKKVTTNRSHFLVKIANVVL